MRELPHVGRVVVAGAITGVIAVGALVSATKGAQSKAPDVQLASRAPNGSCGAFADSLPPLITAAGVVPGATVADLSLCIRNAGSADGTLFFGTAEMRDLDTACTGDEATVDTSCGGGAAGELSPRLIQRVGITDTCRGTPATNPAWDRPLAQLAVSPVVIASRLQKGKQLCARLVLRYEPTSAAAVAAQSDRATWRYAFTLTGDD